MMSVPGADSGLQRAGSVGGSDKWRQAQG